jgi:hypothetical protein
MTTETSSNPQKLADEASRTPTAVSPGSSERIAWPDSSIGSEDALQMAGDPIYSDPIMKAILTSPDCDQLLTSGPTEANSQMLVSHFARNVLKS